MDQSSQQCFANETTGRHHREKVRFVGNNQIIIRMQDACFERDAYFIRYLAKVVDGHSGAIRVIDGQRMSVYVQHALAFEAMQPLFAGNAWKERAQAVDYGQPLALGKLHRAG